MDFFKQVFTYLFEHGPALGSILLAFVSLSEMIVRMTPTKKDDTAVERLGKFIRKAMDAFEKIVPNKKKDGGKHVKQKEKEGDIELSESSK